MPASDDLHEVAVGAERGRRAAWAKYYEAERNLRLYRGEDGRTWVYFACPCCGSVTEMEVAPAGGDYPGCLVHEEGMEVRRHARCLEPHEWAQN